MTENMKYLLIVVLFATSFVPLLQCQAQEIVTTEESSVVYELPYPGILPDNPFYFMKQFRDWIERVTIQDTLSKAEKYVEHADKRVAMANPLAIEKGKPNLALDITATAQEHLDKAIELLKDEDIEDQDTRRQLINRMKDANIRHRIEIESILQEIPQGQEVQVQELLQKNTEITEELDLLD